jgi:hypothetical protein
MRDSFRIKNLHKYEYIGQSVVPIFILVTEASFSFA